MRKASASRSTTSRKKEHVQLTLTRDVGFRRKTTGLDDLEFEHNCLPEINLSDISTETTFLRRTLAMPLMVSCMTGGYPDARTINRQLAEMCEEVGIAMGVGSQRQALEDDRFHSTFTIVRTAAPSVPIVGNIGAAEVARTPVGQIRRLVDLVHADAFAVHLNPLQEFLQPEGNTNFRGVLAAIEELVRTLGVPVIVKEIGAGISPAVASRLLDAGVTHIDIAGAGGTSWAGVEALRSGNRSFGDGFWDWGIPTAVALREIAALRKQRGKFFLIASGGIATGIDVAKCIALGADLVSSARPVLTALHRGKQRGLRQLFASWGKALRGVMFLTGADSIAALQQVPLVRYR